MHYQAKFVKSKKLIKKQRTDIFLLLSQINSLVGQRAMSAITGSSKLSVRPEVLWREQQEMGSATSNAFQTQVGYCNLDKTHY